MSHRYRSRSETRVPRLHTCRDLTRVAPARYRRGLRTIRLTDPRGRLWEVEVPTSRRERARGLLGRSDVPDGRAMLFEHARSVHTFGMRFPIRVAFLDRHLEVLETRTVEPHRLLLPRLPARHVLECRAQADIRPGDRLRLIGSGDDRGAPAGGKGRGAG